MLSLGPKLRNRLCSSRPLTSWARVAYRVVSATTGKLTRTEPVAALYEQGRVSHIGHHPELEGAAF